MSAYYNEFDPQAAAWLRELIKRGLIADGDVDERDMREVEPDELKGYTQHHFFAGIGGWSLALRLAGWADDRPVLTGSPPCQPFSSAGKGRGTADERHLAPHFLRLVTALRPPVLFGEQVAAAVNKDYWLDDLLDALEGEGYATGAIVLPACGVGAPHIRQRLWFTGRRADTQSVEQQHATKQERRCHIEGASGTCMLGGSATKASSDSGMADSPRQRFDRSESSTREARWRGAENNGPDGGLAESDSARPQQGGQTAEGARHGHTADAEGSADRDGSTNAPAFGWDAVDWIFCRDGKWRPVEPGAFPLAHGVPARVGRLRGYGNAIVPQVAVEVIRCVMDAVK